MLEECSADVAEVVKEQRAGRKVAREAQKGNRGRGGRGGGRGRGGRGRGDLKENVKPPANSAEAFAEINKTRGEELAELCANAELEKLCANTKRGLGNEFDSLGAGSGDEPKKTKRGLHEEVGGKNADDAQMEKPKKDPSHREHDHNMYRACSVFPACTVDHDDHDAGAA
jgi:hypothetical protein